MRTERFKRVLLSVLMVAALITLAIPLSQVSSISATPDGLVPHDPILIEGNDNFIPANGVSSGSGMLGDPYVIEGWDIEPKIKLSHGLVGLSGIQIIDTDACFIIRNRKVHDGKAENLSGITFYNVKNGKIEKNDNR